MAGKIINLIEYRSVDPHRDYYGLPLKKRFEEYNRWVWREASNHRKKVLGPLYDSEQGEQRLTPPELTEELKEMLPSFRGTVLRRDYNAWPSYVITSADMQALFGDSVFGKVSGKIITAADNLLSTNHHDLAGQIILIGEQESLEKEGFIASHEGYHASHTRYPNALRRDRYHDQLKDRGGLSPEELARIMINLDRAIQIDEAGAVIDSYHWLECRTWKPWIPGGNGAYYDVGLIKGWFGGFEKNLVPELKNSSRNTLGFQLSSIRAGGRVGTKIKDMITQHEKDSLLFPPQIQRVVESLSQKLQNPESHQPLSYAMTYVMEALQIVDFPEIMSGKLEAFCIDFLEPYRLSNWQGFAPAFASALLGNESKN